MQPITFITGNQAKVKWLQQFLNIPIEHRKIDLVEIQSLDLKEVVTYKAKEAYRQIKKTVLVEDTSLIFNALGKLPGPLIKWFLEELGKEGLCHLLDNYSDRSALAAVMYGLYDGKTLHTFSAEIPGSIADHPRGSNAHGWDYSFIPKGAKKTWGEMNDHEQKGTSMRAISLKKLEEYLKNNP